MTNSELRGNLARWLSDFEMLSEGKIPNSDKLVLFLASRIEDSVFIEKDLDVLAIKKDGKTQYARVLSEDKSRGVISLQLLDDRSYMMITYGELKKMCPGSAIVAALDEANGSAPARPF
jgi:hypothetical protein